MSWWDTGEAGDVIGDQPADIVGRVLRRIADERSQQARPKPTLSELLRAVGTVAVEARGKRLTGVPENLQEISAELKARGTVSSGPLRDDEKTRDLTAELRTAVDEIAEIYKSRWERNPKFSEWLEISTFVLGAQPERYIEDGKSKVLKKLTAI
jgi:hypothetical protein